jgi:hypothetical protein
MTSTPVFLAFPDGALAYDCSGCDQRCCKTGTLAVHREDVAPLIQMHPALELVASSNGHGTHLFATPLQGCWFLKDTRCSLVTEGDGHSQSQHKAPRPRNCSLFPFNLVGRLGDIIVVAPNGLCPLRVKPGEGMRHEHLLETIAATGSPFDDTPESLRPEGAALLPLEAAIVHVAQRSLADDSPLPLLGFTQLITEAHLQNRLESTDLSELPIMIEAFGEEAQVFAEILDLPCLDAQDLSRITPLFNAWTPTLRLFGFNDLPLSCVPRAMLALALMASYWHKLCPDTPIQAHTLLQMVGGLGPTFRLLALWNSPWDGLEIQGWILPGQIPRDVISPKRFHSDPDNPVNATMSLRRLAQAQGLHKKDLAT